MQKKSTQPKENTGEAGQKETHGSTNLTTNTLKSRNKQQRTGENNQGQDWQLDTGETHQDRQLRRLACWTLLGPTLARGWESSFVGKELYDSQGLTSFEVLLSAAFISGWIIQSRHKPST